MTAYEVKVAREGRWWMVEIPALNGLTQARRLGEAEMMARDYIATQVGIAVDEVELGRIQVEADGLDLSAVETELARLRRTAAEAEAGAARLMQDTAVSLNRRGIPLRDIAAVLGVSFQRVAQIL